MKLSTFKPIVVMALLLPAFYGCPKSKSALAPEPDMELQSSIDAVFATFLVTDIEMVCAHVAQNDNAPDFYIAQPGEDPSKFIYFNPAGQTNYVATFNDMKCKDGRRRKGTIIVNYANTNPNAKYYSNYQFTGKGTMSAYYVDGWLIRTVGGVPFEITNELKTAAFDPKVTNLVWTIKGNFELIHPTDPSKNMTWSGELSKTLVNTSQSDVYTANRPLPIDWTKAIVNYTGKVKGTTSGNVPFELSINPYFPLIRDFMCYPSEIGGIETTSPLKTWKNEFHPFISGKLDFKTGAKYPRQIFLGNEGVEGSLMQCDNSGIVLIKGNSYAVDFN